MSRPLLVGLVLLAVAGLATCNKLRSVQSVAENLPVCSIACGPNAMLDAHSCTCKCPPYFAGEHCVTCVRQCENGGELDSTSCSCVCNNGFSGENCEHGETTGGFAPLLGASDLKLGRKATPELRKLADSLHKIVSSPSDVPGEMSLDEQESSEHNPMIAALTETSSESSDLMSEAIQVAESSEICRNWRYEICKGQNVSDKDGEFVLAEKVVCSHFETAADTLKILSLRPGTDEDQYLTREKLVPAASIANGDATTPSHHEDLTRVGHEFGYRICFMSEKEDESLPEAVDGAASPIVHLKCTVLAPRAVLSAWMISKIFKLSKASTDVADAVNLHTTTDFCEAPESYSKKCCHPDWLPDTCGAPSFGTDKVEMKKKFATECEVEWPESTINGKTEVDYTHRCPEGWMFKANEPIPAKKPEVMDLAETASTFNWNRRLSRSANEDENFAVTSENMLGAFDYD